MENRIYLYTDGSNRQMMSFVITTEDGRLIVIDGGYDENAPALLSALKSITGKEKPHIDAWLLSHAHEDHINAFAVFYEKYTDLFTCDAVYYTFPSIPYFDKYEHGTVPTLARFYNNLPKVGTAAHIVCTGDVYRVGEAEIEVLQTYDDTITEDIVNNSSTVFTLRLGGKRLIFLGDTGELSGKRLVARYGDTLKSDICQPAHHGQDGATEEVYAAIRPDACLWCTPDWLWENNYFYSHDPATAGMGPFTTLETRAWLEKIGTKTHYIAKDGDQEISI